MNKYRAMFLAEVDKIENAKLKKAAKALVKDMPDYFWEKPASSSGKYHPTCDLGEGGTVRHSILVSRVAVDLVVSEMFIRETAINTDMARFAGLFHDCMKYGNPEANLEHTVFEHPRFAADFVREHLTVAKVDDVQVNMICDAIYTHMGKWCVDKYGKSAALSKPRTHFEKLIHIADYMASRKYIGGLEEWA